MTYPGAACDDAIRAVGQDRVLLETDAPYSNPAATGGRKHINEPKNVAAVAEYVAAVLGLPLRVVVDAATGNTKRFFHIPNLS